MQNVHQMGHKLSFQKWTQEATVYSVFIFISLEQEWPINHMVLMQFNAVYLTYQT